MMIQQDVGKLVRKYGRELVFRFDRLRMGLIRVKVSGETFIFNHSQMKITGARLPDGVNKGCNAVRTSTGERRSANIGIGLGGCK